MESKSLIWVLTQLTIVGGGEKLLLEGVKYYRSIGYKVYIITWDFNEVALFNNTYENKDIINLKRNFTDRNQIFSRAFDRFKSLFRLRRLIKNINPEFVFCQGEYDVATVFVARLFTGIPYIFLIFGQMFQYPHDIGKYALVFRKHLKEIIDSQPGYKETIPLAKPKVSFINNIVNELISFLRFFAVKNATARFVFSKNLQWETQLLYNSPAIILKGAYNDSIFYQNADVQFVKKKFNIPANSKILLSFSRLDSKKRIDQIINSLLYLDENIILLIAGTGQDLNRLVKITNSLNLAHRVFFLGYISESDANPLKITCDLFISMDIGDFDISPFEAMALGKKTIFSTEIDLDEDLKSFKNLYISEANPEILADKIRKALASNGFPYINIMKKYTWENYFSNILNYSISNTLNKTQI